MLTSLVFIWIPWSSCGLWRISIYSLPWTSSGVETSEARDSDMPPKKLSLKKLYTNHEKYLEINEKKQGKVGLEIVKNQ